MRTLLILFIVIPIIEMWGLIKVGGMIGAGYTIFLVFATAAVGLALLRHQGYSTFMRAQQRASQGQLPLHEMIEGVFFAVGGALLLTPGFFTDAIGFCCLVPGLRHHIIAWGLKNLVRVRVAGAANAESFGFNGQTHSHGGPGADAPRARMTGDVIEGEFSRDESNREDAIEK